MTWLGATGAFVTPAGAPPLPILISVVLPLTAFFAGYWLVQPFRRLVLAADLQVMVGIHAWRFAGLSFLALYTYGILPGSFALPAGLGDMAIGVTAPWMLAALIRQPAFAASKTFVVWNVLGIIDLVAAMAAGALNAIFAANVAGEARIDPMVQLPLVLITAYLVPFLAMLHAAALLQARRLAAIQAGSGSDQG
ncbi:hypothetical protein LT85_1383 [Collimonas arenae]|uniref:Transmembrane protein n=1 Tax=Collimonas arenae TaxID=279058 RepID=A0A0A1F7N2_9BURK|nr:hypothetical protein LT85_1383 [Collimonas arenae]